MAAKVGVAQAQPVKPERSVPGIHSVQGINSHVEDIRLRGQKLVAVIGDAIAEATLVRKIVGASELTLTILDPNRRLLRSKLLREAHEITLDGLHWKLVKVSAEGRNEPLVLTYEPRVVYDLKKLKGPHKAFRDKMTRAEFAKARAFEARPRPRFVSPELHVVQDIASAADGKRAKKHAEESRGKGIGVHDPNLKINDLPATKHQAEIIERMLRVAESEGAATKVMEALVLAVIDESIVGTLSDNLLQIEPESVSGFHGDPTNPEQSARGFLRGYESSAPGALGVYKAHPDYSPAQIATTVQRNAAGAGPYERFTEEGRAWVAAYGGGSEVTTTDFERYAFSQSKTESNWHCMVRLATEVHWRCFESAAWIYYLDDPTLLRSSHRMRVSDVAPGIIDTSFDYDVGKEVTEVIVEALAKTWAAPPGTVAAVSRHGPANGLYLVEQIESKPSSHKDVVNVTLRKPTEPLPEPAPQSKSGSVSFGGGSGSGVWPPKVQAIVNYIDRASAASTSYEWGGGHGSFASPDADKDCSGFVSAAVHAAGYLSVPVTSGVFAEKFPHGEGEWVTIYGNAKHVFMAVKYPDGHWRYAGTGGSPAGGGWVDDNNGTSGAPARGDKTASHPPGL
jgi:hypothetical protein